MTGKRQVNVREMSKQRQSNEYEMCSIFQVNIGGWYSATCPKQQLQGE